MVEPNKTQENKSLLTFDIILPRFEKEVRSENTMKITALLIIILMENRAKNVEDHNREECTRWQRHNP